MKSIVKVFLSLFVISFIISTFIIQNANASIEKKIDSSFSAIIEKVNKEISLNSELSFSSNPYDYIKGNTDFDEIVNLGNDALPFLQKRLSDSKSNGLLDYITAIAIERIAKVDLKKKETSHWSTAKEFNEKWIKQLKTTPTTVDLLVSNTTLSPDEKVKELIDLGTPALPFILDRVENGDDKLFAAIIELTHGSKEEVPGDIVNKTEWIQNNKTSFNKLKQYILEQK